jgi:phosphatidylserine/phosphatidylglycerophosphate/cardiolipin synthase-like enzyme
MSSEVVFSRVTDIAERIGRLICETAHSLDAALYRLDNPQLAEALRQSAARGTQVRLILDRGKYDSDAAMRALVAGSGLRCRLVRGRAEPDSKMHHKFAILDDRTVLTGSYNWTLESQEYNYENLLILRDPQRALEYKEEFEALWERAARQA